MKYYYSISEVAKLIDVKPPVLRYWEEEFKELHPKKTKGGRRAYTKKEIDLISSIKRLLYEERYSIEGARKKLKNNGGASSHEEIHPKVDVGEADKNILQEIKQGLKEILEILGSDNYEI